MHLATTAGQRENLVNELVIALVARFSGHRAWCTAIGCAPCAQFTVCSFKFTRAAIKWKSEMCTHNPIQSISEPSKGIWDGNGKEKGKGTGNSVALSSPGPHSNCRVVKDSRHFIDFVFVGFPQLVVTWDQPRLSSGSTGNRLSWWLQLQVSTSLEFSYVRN